MSTNRLNFLFDLKALLLVVSSKRFQERSKNFFRLSVWAAIIIVLFSLPYLTLKFIRKYIGLKQQFEQVSNFRLETNLTKNQKKSGIKQVDLKRIFGPLKTPLDTSKVTTKPPVNKPKISLLATFIYPDKRYAILEYGGKNIQDAFELGESVFDEATLEKVERGYVSLRWPDGSTDDYFIEENISGGAQSAVAQVSFFNISRETLNEALSDVQTLVSQIRVIPFFKDGKPTGLRLFAIRPGSVFEMIGLRNGDLLKSIDGVELRDLEKLSGLMQILKEKDRIKVTIERENKDLEFVYDIR